MGSGKNIALFDFDGTLTRRDSLFLFLRFCIDSKSGYVKLILKNLCPLLKYILGLLSGDEVKLILVSCALRGMSHYEIERLCDAFIPVIEQNLRSGALLCLKDYKQMGFRNVIVSASPGMWIRPWALKTGLIDDVIATELEFNGGIRYIGENCKGEEKVNRIRKLFQPRAGYYIVAYGDSKDDRPMLRYADKAYYRSIR